mmetsp:Transcript_19424/g.41513  ORF Transcript_19424/g.41513 Transcript_19424/m.41513 type:complete len:125 (-) Transcript_19424:1540-1914(-)
MTIRASRCIQLYAEYFSMEAQICDENGFGSGFLIEPDLVPPTAPEEWQRWRILASNEGLPSPASQGCLRAWSAVGRSEGLRTNSDDTKSLPFLDILDHRLPEKLKLPHVIFLAMDFMSFPQNGI